MLTCTLSSACAPQPSFWEPHIPTPCHLLLQAPQKPQITADPSTQQTQCKSQRQALLPGCFKHLAGCEPRWLTAGLAREISPQHTPAPVPNSKRSKLGRGRKGKRTGSASPFRPYHVPTKHCVSLSRSHPTMSLVFLSVKWRTKTLPTQVKGHPKDAGGFNSVVTMATWLHSESEKGYHVSGSLG